MGTNKPKVTKEVIEIIKNVMSEHNISGGSCDDCGDYEYCNGCNWGTHIGWENPPKEEFRYGCSYEEHIQYFMEQALEIVDEVSNE